MKRIILMIAVLSLLVFIAGCGKDTMDDDRSDNTDVDDSSLVIPETGDGQNGIGDPEDEFAITTVEIESDIDLSETEDIASDLDGFDW